MNQIGIKNFVVEDYHEQAVGSGADARAMAYVPLTFDYGESFFGVGTDTNIDQAAVRAIIAALNRKTRIQTNGSSILLQLRNTTCICHNWETLRHLWTWYRGICCGSGT